MARRAKDSPHKRLPHLTWEGIEAIVDGFPEKDRRSIREWNAWRRDVEEMAPGTQRIYLSYLQQASRAVSSPLLADATALESHALAKARTMKRPNIYLAPFKSFLEFHKADAKWTIPARPRSISRKKRERSSKQPKGNLVSEAEFEEALESCVGPMWRAILYVLWDAGFRTGELLSIRYGDVVHVESTLKVDLPPDDESFYPLKTGPREVILIEAVAALKEWLSYHPTKAATDPLFVGFAEKARRQTGAVTFLSPDMLERFIADVCHDHLPNDFRHTAATRATLRGWNDALMRSFFGWSANSNMPSYYRIFTQEDANRMRLKEAGLLVEGPEKPVRAVRCPACNTENARENVYCFACKSPLRSDLIKKELARAASVTDLLDDEDLLAKIAERILPQALEFARGQATPLRKSQGLPAAGRGSRSPRTPSRTRRPREARDRVRDRS
ncbi:MAG: tyrosine-type recombinase/integrase [Thermoplasmatota archaeon]